MYNSISTSEIYLEPKPEDQFNPKSELEIYNILDNSRLLKTPVIEIILCMDSNQKLSFFDYIKI